MYFFKTFFQYLQDNFFNSSLNGHYEYLEITETATTLLMIIGGLCLGMIVAAFAIFFQKKVIARFVRALLYAQAYDENSAKTLEELGFAGDAVIRQEISHASMTRKVIGIVEDGKVYLYEEELAAAFPGYTEQVSGKKKTSFLTRIKNLFRRNKSSDSTDKQDDPTVSYERVEVAKKGKLKFHRPDFQKAKFFIPESMKYRAQNRFSEKGVSSLWLILFVILSIVLFFLALRFLPMFVNMIDVSIGNFLGN